MEFNGTALIEARDAKGMSRELLAGLSGCSVQTIANAEEQRNQPNGTNVAAWARILEVSMDDLYRHNGAPQ